MYTPDKQEAAIRMNHGFSHGTARGLLRPSYRVAGTSRSPAVECYRRPNTDVDGIIGIAELGRPESMPAACASLRGSHLPFGPTPPRIMTLPTSPPGARPLSETTSDATAAGTVIGGACEAATTTEGAGVAAVAIDMATGALVTRDASDTCIALDASWRFAVAAVACRARNGACIGTLFRDCSIADTKRMRWYGCGALARSGAACDAGVAVACAAVGVSGLLHALRAAASKSVATTACVRMTVPTGLMP
jgi:hypothetical protein